MQPKSLHYQEVTTSSDDRGTVAFDNDCRRYTTLLKKDHISTILHECFKDFTDHMNGLFQPDDLIKMVANLPDIYQIFYQLES